ncbi:fatty-acyl-CoA synthase [Flexivirga oryzae]|uniref:Fatty-acyl-CoA synthase n=1 Tax=Flexivirga oryzae TaxID=1794944 RepID=A0A839N761_9MICO|nr:AMP-binding protein [Flexivirga oryzae]MBB2893588.1 fatty-acyl-CoA synthase [Flexivirga oryzae]
MRPLRDESRSLTAMLAASVERAGERTALIEDGMPTTYAELADRARRLAAGLGHAGIGRGDAVAVWLPNRTQWAELVFAAAHLGAVAVGVNTRYRSRELLHVLRESGARALVVEPGFKGIDFAGMLAEAAAVLPDSLRLLISVGGGSLPPVDAATADYETLFDPGLPDAPDVSAPGLPVSAFNSSGTTGAPKLVMHTQGGIVAHSVAVADAFGYRAPGTTVLAALPMCGVFGFNTVLAGLAAGAAVVLLPEFSADATVATMREHHVTHANLADEMLRRILDVPGALARLPEWRECGFGAFTALDPRALAEAGEAAGKKFFQTYGSSEVLAVMTYPAPGADVERRSLGGGVPCHLDVQVRVRDENGRLCGLDEPGEIEIKGPNVTCGYYGIDGIPDLDEDGYFHTGDLGRLVADRDFVYLARAGDALRLAGFLVSPREIEAYLEEQDGVDGAQVVGVDVGTDTVPAAFLTARPGAEIDVDAVLASARRDLARFKVPRLVEVLDEFPITRGTNGVKIQRTSLRERARLAWETRRATETAR